VGGRKLRGVGWGGVGEGGRVGRRGRVGGKDRRGTMLWRRGYRCLYTGVFADIFTKRLLNVCECVRACV